MQGLIATASQPPVAVGQQHAQRRYGASQPNTPEAIEAQLHGEAGHVSELKARHDRLASRWNAVASWTRMTVVLTSGISALSIFADNIAAATTFALITAGVSALNAGFSPPEAARSHRIAARAYSHEVRPLDELLYKLSSSFTWKYVTGGKTVYHPFSNSYYDSGYYRTTRRPNREELDQIWDSFGKIRERLEAADEASPGLPNWWPRDWWPRRTKRLVPDGPAGDPNAMTS